MESVAVGLGSMVVSMRVNSLANLGGRYVTAMPNYSSALTAGALTGVGVGLGFATSVKVSNKFLVWVVYTLALATFLAAALTPNIPKNWVNCDVSYLGAAGYGALGSTVTLGLIIKFISY